MRKISLFSEKINKKIQNRRGDWRINFI